MGKLNFLLGLLSLFSLSIFAQSVPEATGTVRDLKTWKNTSEKYVKLDGNWDFYPGELLTKTDLQTGTHKAAQVTVPSSWTDYTVNGKQVQAIGCGTYHLRVMLPANREQLALQIPFVWSSYRVFINGNELASSGNPSCDMSKGYGQQVKAIIPLREGIEEADIIIQVANYYQFNAAGLLEAPDVGAFQQLLIRKEYRSALNLGIMGSLLIMALYHVLIFLFRRKERAMLYFGLICLIVSLRFAVFGDHYIYEWLNLYSGFFSLSLQIKAYYTFTLLLGFLGTLFFRSLFPGDVWKRLPLIIGILHGAFFLFTLVAPTLVFTASLQLAQVVLGLEVAYLTFVMIRAAVLNRQDARFILIGLGGMLLAGINDGLQTVGVFLLGEAELLTYGFLFFLFVQFVVLARRYSTTFSAVEDLSANLEIKVAQRTEELNLANIEISQKNQDITDSIEYARRIQLAILPKEENFFRFFPDAFIFYLPKDIVSGDFYWFYEREDVLYVCVADCTGHGVPGAFMSVMGNNLLNQLVTENHLPPTGMVLDNMSHLVQDALKQNQSQNRNESSQDGMDMVLCRFREGTNEFQYAGANRPLWQLRKGEIIEYAPTKLPIGGGSSLYNNSETQFEQHSLTLEPGDCLYLFSDGITDQFGGENNRKFSPKRLKELLLQSAHLPMTRQKEILQETLAAWRAKGNQTDDMLIIGIRSPLLPRT